MKKNTPLILGGAAVVAAIYFLTRSNPGPGPVGKLPKLILPRLAKMPTPTVTAITVDTKGVVREVIQQEFSGGSSLIELVILDAKTGVPMYETIAFSRDQYDFRTLPQEVIDLFSGRFDWSFA